MFMRAALRLEPQLQTWLKVHKLFVLLPRGKQLKDAAKLNVSKAWADVSFACVLGGEMAASF